MAGLLSADLAAFLRRMSREPFVVGRSDCALFVADWGREVTGIDGAAHLRGAYDNPQQALSVHGPLGLTRTVDRCARSIGMVRTITPAKGDIGAIVVAGNLVCGIKMDRGWIVRGNHSVWRVDAERVVAAWTARGGGRG